MDEEEEEPVIESECFDKIQGVVPKDIESKKEMMSFIAYVHNLESSVKLLTWS